MKRIVTSLLLVVCLVAMLLLAACGGKTGTTPDGTTTVNQQETAFLAIAALLEASAPTAASSHVVFTTTAGDILEGSYTVLADGSCEYQYEYFIPYEIGVDSEAIGEESGTKTGAEQGSESVALGSLNLALADFVSYQVTGDASGWTLTGEVSDVAAFLGSAVGTGNVSVEIVTSGTAVTQVTLDYAVAGGTVSIVTDYTY